MAEFTFSCPGCGNSVICDSQWSGHQIACPGCQISVLVPAPTPAATPVANAAAAARVRIGGGKKSTGKIVAYVLIGIIAAAGFFYLIKRGGIVSNRPLGAGASTESHRQ
ncbi:MAG: hypothetical protein ACXWIU_10235 [Limisphaerales bacterium]